MGRGGAMIRRHQRHACPLCGKDVADTGPVCWSIPSAEVPERRPYVYLRRHHRPEGGPCPASTAPVADPRRPPEGD